MFAVIMTTDPARVLSHHHSADEAVPAVLKARAAASPEEAPLIVPVAMDDGAYVGIPFLRTSLLTEGANRAILGLCSCIFPVLGFIAKRDEA